MPNGNILEERKTIVAELSLLTEDKRRACVEISQNLTPERIKELQDGIGSIDKSLANFSARLEQLNAGRE